MNGTKTTAFRAAAAGAEMVEVRPARPQDAGSLAALSNQLGYPSSREEVDRRLRRILPDAGHAVFVAEAGIESRPGRGSDAARQDSPRPGLAGWVHVFVEHTVESDATAEIGGLVVGESWRGAGIGRLLMERAERWAREAGCGSVTVRSNVIRERAHAFYERLGYKLVKSQRVFRKPASG